MIRRAVLLFAAVAAGAIIVAAPAGAQSSAPENDDDYTALCIPLTVDNASPQAGDIVNVSGTAATGGATIVIVMNDSVVLAETTSDATTRFFSTAVTIPADTPPGPVTLQAFQLGDNTDPLVGCPASVAGLEIVAAPVAPAPAADELSRTGSNSTLPMARIGFGLLAAGGLALLVSRRRRTVAA